MDALRPCKPDPRVYDLVSGIPGIPKNTVAFVSSNSFDAIGARDFGLRVGWCSHAGASLEEMGFVPDGTVRRLDGIPKPLGV